MYEMISLHIALDSQYNEVTKILGSASFVQFLSLF